MRIEIVEGDLLKADTDVIVNAANTHLAHMGGIAGAISRAAGPQLDRESKQKRPVPTGGAAITTAGKLPFKAVIHAVGPIWRGGSYQEMELLRKAYISAMRAARVLAQDWSEEPIRSVGFPAISCGIFHFPVDLAAPIAVNALRECESLGIDAKFYLLDPDHVAAFTAALK